MKKIIVDCDNTMGVYGSDVDDALALFYIIQEENADLLAITTTYGNSDIDTVYDATKKLLKDIKREDIPLYKGARSIEEENEAGKMLASLARENKGELCILAIGSTTNLNAALRYDRDFCNNVKEFVFMGGITEKLIVGDKQMNELNLSIDYSSSIEILKNAKKSSIITGNNCLKTIFTQQEFEKNLNETAQGRYIIENTRYWFEHNKENYSLDGFYNWDITAAIYLMKNEIFEDNYANYTLFEEDMKTGKLVKAKEGINLNLPKIKSVEKFKEEAYKILAGK